jgi:hypothetical protein
MGNAGASASCSPLAPCGGDPSGHWDLGTAGAAGAAGAANATGTCAIPELSADDGCKGFEYFPASSPTPGITAVSLPLPRMAAISQADLQLNPDQSYLFQLASVGNATLQLTPACLTAHGANPTCGELQSQLHTAAQVLTLDSSNVQKSSAFDFCASTDALTLSWLPSSQALLSPVFGLRTLSLKRAQ